MNFITRTSTICSVLALNLFLSQAVYAQNAARTNLSHTDQAEAAVLIPWQFVQKWVNEKSVSERSSTSPQTLIDEKLNQIDFVVADIPVHIPSAQILVHGSFAPVQVQNNLTRWQTENLFVDLHLAGFEVEKEFVKDVDGATIIVTLKAKCGDFSIRQNQAQFMTGLAWQAISQGFDLRAQELEITWPANSWSVESLVCEGPEGFGAIVQNQISEALKDPTQIESLVKPLMETRLNSYVTEALDPLKKPSFIENNKIFSVSIGETAVASDRGLVINVHIVTSPEYQGVSEPQMTAVVIPENVWSQVNENPILVLPKKFIVDVARHAKIFPRAENLLNNIPAFQKILDSRLLQFFFWSELRKFRKDASFKAISLVQGQDYAVPANAPRLSFQGNQRLSVSAGVSTWVRAERDGQEINFGYFDTKITGEASYRLLNGQMNFKLENPSVNMTATYAGEYMTKYKPKGKFPVSRLQKGMRAQLEGRSFQLALPVLNLETLGMKDQLQAKTVTEQGANLVFAFENQRQP